MFNLTYGIPNSLVLPGNLTVGGNLVAASATIGGRDISLSGNLSVSGNYSLLFGLTGNTTLVLPTGGYLTTQLGYEPLQNKTITNSSINVTSGVFTSGLFTAVDTTSTVRAGYCIITGALAKYNSPSGGLYLAFANTTSIIRSVIDNGGNAGTISMQVGNGTEVARFTSYGLDNVKIGTLIPDTGVFTVLNISSNAGIVSTKSNLNINVNIKDYGAVGNNSTDNTSAIASAISALPSNGGSLYIPAGIFITDVISFSSKSGITIYGDGIGTSVLKSRLGSQVLNIGTTCSGFTVHDLTFNGNCTGRTAGQQAVICDATKSSFYNNEVLKAGEFAVYFGGNGDVDSCSIVNNWIHDVYADGINVAGFTNGIIADNIVNSDDDCIALSSRSTTLASNNLVSNNNCRARNDLGTNWGRGLVAINGANGNTFVGNKLSRVKQYGLYVSSEGGYRPYGNSFIGNEYLQCGVNAGGGAFIDRADNTIINGESMLSPVGGDMYLFADVTGLTIQNCVMRQTGNYYCRGVHTVESAGSYSPKWARINIKGNIIDFPQPSTNEAIYLNPAAGITLSGVIIDGNASYIGSAGTAIYTNRLTGFAKIVNNTTINGIVAPSNGGVGLSPTLANNN